MGVLKILNLEICKIFKFFLHRFYYLTVYSKTRIVLPLPLIEQPKLLHSRIQQSTDSSCYTFPCLPWRSSISTEGRLSVVFLVSEVRIMTFLDFRRLLEYLNLLLNLKIFLVSGHYGSNVGILRTRLFSRFDVGLRIG